LASMILFVRSMSKSIIRRVSTGDNRRSLRVRDEAQTVFLAQHGKQIVVAELDGPLFFGTGDKLTQWSAALPEEVRYVVLDFRRVSEVDATGARLLAHLSKDFNKRGGQAVLAHLASEADATIFHEMGVDRIVPKELWFADADHALEWAEDDLLRSRFGEVNDGEIALSELPVFAGCDDATKEVVAANLDRRDLKPGEVLFREGDTGAELYFLVDGRIDIELRLDANGGRARRLSTVGPGAIIGEMALFAGKARLADAVAVGNASLYALSETAFRKLLAERPEAANALLLNIGRELSTRLAVTNQELRLVEG